VVLAPYGDALSAQVSASTKITPGYGGELGYQAPLWVARELKLFAKHGMTSKLVRIAGAFVTGIRNISRKGRKKGMDS
jgi:ABC-type nitrate/sulfonate/bicarbonate transport system substrate-binding protein